MAKSLHVTVAGQQVARRVRRRVKRHNVNILRAFDKSCRELRGAVLRTHKQLVMLVGVEGNAGMISKLKSRLISVILKDLQMGYVKN